LETVNVNKCIDEHILMVITQHGQWQRLTLKKNVKEMLPI